MTDTELDLDHDYKQTILNLIDEVKGEVARLEDQLDFTRNTLKRVGIELQTSENQVIGLKDEVTYAGDALTRVNSLNHKLIHDTGKGCSICGETPVVNVPDGTYWLCGGCVGERLDERRDLEARLVLIRKAIDPHEDAETVLSEITGILDDLVDLTDVSAKLESVLEDAHRLTDARLDAEKRVIESECRIDDLQARYDELKEKLDAERVKRHAEAAKFLSEISALRGLVEGEGTDEATASQRIRERKGSEVSGAQAAALPVSDKLAAPDLCPVILDNQCRLKLGHHGDHLDVAGKEWRRGDGFIMADDGEGAICGKKYGSYARTCVRDQDHSGEHLCYEPSPESPAAPDVSKA